MSLRIVLDLDPAAQPIAGTIAAEGEPPQPFSGWLALGHTLSEALDGARDRQGQPADRAGQTLRFAEERRS